MIERKRRPRRSHNSFGQIKKDEGAKNYEELYKWQAAI